LLVYPQQNRQKVPETLNIVGSLFNVNWVDGGSIKLQKVDATDICEAHPTPAVLIARHDQESAFLTRIHDNKDHPTARPLVELGFDEPAKESEVQQWAKAFSDHGLGGFTIARDSRGKALGIRSQAIPEFAGVDRDQYMNAWTKGARE
jgi:hypothetical protein